MMAAADGRLVKASQQLDTDRLVLVAPAAGDAAEMFARYASDDAVTRYLGWTRHRTIDDTQRFIEFSIAEWERWPAGPYLIRARADGRLLGSTGLGFEREDEAITGYVLAADAWGQGYATEALRAMVDLSRALALRRLYALCHTDHRASAHVLEKCGFTRDAEWSSRSEFPNLLPGARQPVLCYELWLDAQAAPA
jgi:ribosomal-protein-alanine N-acetyltransferase